LCGVSRRDTENQSGNCDGNPALHKFFDRLAT
jgi:hypothetical protein